MKKIKLLSISALILLFGGCKNSLQKTNDNCSETLALDSIFSDYETRGNPLAAVDFHKPLNPEWIQNDFQILRLILEESNPNIYRYKDKSTIDSLFQRKICTLKDSTSYLEFIQHIAQVFNSMACGHSGWAHSKDFHNYRSTSIKFFPLNIVSINDRYFITQNNSTDSTVPISAEIVHINNLSPVEINAILRKHMYQDGTSTPNTEAEISKYFKNAYSNFIANPDTFNLVLKQENGDTIRFQLLALSKRRIDSISNIRYPKKETNGLPLRLKVDSVNKLALYTIKSFRNQYIQQSGQNFNAFTDSVFNALHSNDVSNLIIDLRGNKGGWTGNGTKLFSHFIDIAMPYVLRVELNKVDSFSFEPLILSNQGILDSMRFRLSKKGQYEWTNYPNLEVTPSGENQFKGNTYILIDEESRSCSSVFSSMMQSHTNAIFIGEENGASQGGQGGMIMTVALPFTGIRIYTSTAKYSLNVKNPDKSRGIDVDYIVKKKISDPIDNYDKQLEFTYNLIKERTTTKPKLH